MSKTADLRIEIVDVDQLQKYENNQTGKSRS